MKVWSKIKSKIGRADRRWTPVSQAPMTPFPLPREWRLKAGEELTLALPKAIVAADEPLKSVIRCHRDAQFSSPPDQEFILMRLQPGMVLSLAKSCQVMVVASDHRPRSFALLKKVPKWTEDRKPTPPSNRR